MSISVSEPSELPAIEELTHAHRPVRLAFLGDLTQVLSATTAVTHLLVRGSLATGTADRLSDATWSSPSATRRCPH
ncbi:hypothetical protein [Streptomyces zagrosensis]|uniref:Uncharacterized protein YabE (DUF348 family) n=1 Tax=Streptomyces zagrosensis TaxID=1042984 RepID=A0A7W9QFM4_9ACTN|nr:hypothetical protein [Streptomyces zagrosensis]MBB5939246.1 uncharacterized protein YabE (DUF348 family) [Streptomyces zagrosensis]